MFVVLIRKALAKNVALSVWLCETFSHPEIIKEFFIDCPIPDMGRFICGLLNTAMETVYKHEEESIYDYMQFMETGIDAYILKTQG